MDGLNQGRGGDSGASEGTEDLGQEPVDPKAELESISIASAAAAYNMHHLAEDVRKFSSRPPALGDEEENASFNHPLGQPA